MTTTKNKKSSDEDSFYFNNGAFVLIGGRIDEFGNPVERTKEEYPYSYDGFVTWRRGTNEEANTTVYSDRLNQWDHQKNKELKLKHFGSERDFYSGYSWEQVQAYLQEYENDPTIKLIFIMEYCHTNGNPYWRFEYHTSKTK